MDKWIGLLVVGFGIGMIGVLFVWILERCGITMEKKAKKDNGGKKGNKPKVEQKQ